MQAYRDRLDRQIIPALGAVRIGKLTVGLVDRHLSAVKSRNGSGVAKMTKSVLSGVCGLATRHDALESNPCRDVAAISTKPKKEPTSLSAEQIEKIHASSGSGRQANIDNLCSVAEPKPVIDPESPTVKQLRHPAPTRTRDLPPERHATTSKMQTFGPHIDDGDELLRRKRARRSSLPNRAHFVAADQVLSMVDMRARVGSPSSMSDSLRAPNRTAPGRRTRTAFCAS